VAVHRPQQPGRDRHQRVVAARAGGERVDPRRSVDGDLGHPEPRVLGLAADGVDQPLLGLVARLLDHVGTSGPLGHPFGKHQRDHGAAETERGSHHDRRAVVAQAHAEHALQHAQDDAQQHHHGQVGCEEKRDALEHVVTLARTMRDWSESVAGSAGIQDDRRLPESANRTRVATATPPTCPCPTPTTTPPAPFIAAGSPPRPLATSMRAPYWPPSAAGCSRAVPEANGWSGSKTWTRRARSPARPTGNSPRCRRSGSNRTDRWSARAPAERCTRTRWSG